MHLVADEWKARRWADDAAADADAGKSEAEAHADADTATLLPDDADDADDAAVAALVVPLHAPLLIAPRVHCRCIIVVASGAAAQQDGGTVRLRLAVRVGPCSRRVASDQSRSESIPTRVHDEIRV